MLSLGSISPAPASPSLSNATLQYPHSRNFHFPTKTHNFILSFIVSSPLLSQSRTGFNLFSLKSALEIEDLDDDDDEDIDEDDEFVPLMNMKKWLEEKPRGFGEGRDYDTSVEDKLLDEMQQSSEAQLANINKLKNRPQVQSTKNLGEKASEVAPSEFRVRLFNLPKKKNIDRDLQRAFKGIPGIVNIILAVSGKKTRDPVCKGFAFVYLISEEHAHRFAQVVSGQSISFGKIEKQIRCEVIPSKAQNSAPMQPIVTDFGANDSSSDSWDSISFDDSDTTENAGHINLETMDESVLGSKSSKQVVKVGSNKKQQKANKRERRFHS